MDELISRKALTEYPFQRGKPSCDEKNANPHFLNGAASVIEFAENLPTIDAVEVVRCRDCKHRYTFECAMHMHKSEWTDDNSFCNWGKRKEEQNGKTD